MRRALVALLLIVVACGGGGGAPVGPELPEIDPPGLEALLESSGRPAVVNIWASWCIPCRSEAPLLRAAHERFADEVDFIGVAVADRQDPARAFLTEFDLTFDNYFDRSRAVPGSLGRTGVPITFFFDAGGNLVDAHSGVIDERTLALGIDELLAGR